jgi:hypothetical protein
MKTDSFIGSEQVSLSNVTPARIVMENMGVSAKSDSFSSLLIIIA